MSDPYEKLRKRLEQFPINCVSGRGILEFLKLLFTEQEAEMLSKFKSFQKFVMIDEFARNNGYDKDIVYKTFHDLGKRNLIRYERRKNEDFWCIHPFVIGLYEAFFSSWRKQDSDKLVPAALAVDEYFNSVFYKAASDSKFPWARVIPTIRAIDKIIEKNPQICSDDKESQNEGLDQFQKSTSLLKYGIKEIGERIKKQGIGDALDLIREDGPVIFESFTKIISSFLGFGEKKGVSILNTLGDLTGKTEKKVKIDEDLPASLIIHPYEVIRNFINQASSISVNDCSCRKHRQLLDEVRPEGERINCKYPMEGVCMQLRYDDQIAHEYNMMGGHEVTKEEALKILDNCEKAGLVHSTFNSREKIEFICNCCSCCCGILGTLTRFNQNYRAFVDSNFIPYLKIEQCIKCGNCVKICPVNAITHENDKNPIINPDNCIGCGVCVSNCPKNALELIKVRDQRPALDAIEVHAKFANQKINR